MYWNTLGVPGFRGTILVHGSYHVGKQSGESIFSVKSVGNLTCFNRMSRVGGAYRHSASRNVGSLEDP